MPTAQVHIDKQNKAQLALSNLQQSQINLQHGDWIVTIAFYKALHAVDSYFEKQGIDSKGHDKRHPQRGEQVKRYLGSIYVKYSALYEASIKARYEAYIHNSQEVTRLVNHALDIEKYVKARL